MHMLPLSSRMVVVDMASMKLEGLQLAMGVDEQCKVLCRIPSLSAEEAKAFKTRIEEEYRVNMYDSRF